jgi:large subunit ribosomal protein L29
MELAKIRNLGDEELAHQEKVSAEQLFRLRFQVSMGQNDGVKKLRQLRKEIAQIKTSTPLAEEKAVEAKEATPVVEKKATKAKKATTATETKTAKAKGARK